MDKRIHQRARLDVYLNKVVGDEVFMCRAADISTEGIYLSRLIEPELYGHRVGLEFALPGSPEVIWAQGEIVREGRRGGAEGSGIRFTALPEGYRELIRRYVESGGARPARRARRRRKAARSAKAKRAAQADPQAVAA